MYNATMRTENFLGRRAGYSDRIKGGSGLVERIVTPIEEMEGWDRAEIESAVSAVAKEKVAVIDALQQSQGRLKELRLKKDAGGLAEGALKGLNRQLVRTRQRTQDLNKSKARLQVFENRLHRALLKVHSERYLDLHQKAVARVVDGQTAALIEKEYLRLKKLAETGT